MIEEKQNGIEQELHLRDYIDVLIRRRKTFFIAFLSIFLATAIFTFLSEPVYEATSTLYLQEEQGKGILEELDIIAPSVSIDAEIEIVRSRTIAEEVVKKLNLNHKVTKVSKGLSFEINQFKSSDPYPNYKIELIDDTNYEVINTEGKLVGKGKSGNLMIGENITLFIDNLNGKKGDSFNLELIPLSIVVGHISNGIEVRELHKRTNVMKISFIDSDPLKARDIVNELVDAYMKKRISFKTEEAAKTIQFIDSQLKDIKQDLDKAEEALEKYKSSLGLIELDSKAESLIETIAEAEKRRAEISLEKKQMEFAVANLQESIGEARVYTPAVMKNNTVLSRLATTLAELEAKKSSLISEYTPYHPLVRTVTKQIKDIHRKILAIYKEGINSLDEQEASISRVIDGYESEIKQLPSAEIGLAKLMRDTKVNSDIYTFMLQKHEESRIAQASTISNINIIDAAVVPSNPVKPRVTLNVGLGLIIGLFAGVLLIFFQEYLDDTIKDPESAKRELGLPVLAVIPHITKHDTGDDIKRKMLVTLNEPKSAISEVFRSLRTNIHFSSISKKQQVLLITSSFPGEGKTTIFSNLSIILSQIGKKVMIIDCDLRRSFLHDIFEHSKKPGITDILAGDVTIDNAIHDTGIPGVDLITAGTVPPNPAELLGSKEMQSILYELRKNHDFILIDAPPLLAVTDAHLLAGMSDIVMVVLEAGRVPIKVAHRMKELLDMIGTPLAGVIVNDKTSIGTDTYGYRDKYYAYGYYGTYYDKDTPPKESWWRKWVKR